VLLLVYQWLVMMTAVVAWLALEPAAHSGSQQPQVSGICAVDALEALGLRFNTSPLRLRLQASHNTHF
jgi:hypothetical protein